MSDSVKLNGGLYDEQTKAKQHSSRKNLRCRALQGNVVVNLSIGGGEFGDKTDSVKAFFFWHLEKVI